MVAKSKTRKKPKNLAKYYVDEHCIDCGLCYQFASGHFSRNERAEKAYVSKQPETDEEIKHCNHMMNYCPVDAIGTAEQ